VLQGGGGGGFIRRIDAYKPLGTGVIVFFGVPTRSGGKVAKSSSRILKTLPYMARDSPGIIRTEFSVLKHPCHHTLQNIKFQNFSSPNLILRPRCVTAHHSSGNKVISFAI